ncbi:MAG: 3-deoxy-D-manno-octulosonic acid transferase [Ignavibacterium sp.]|nr:3-deoxy-D-manno-octulosonic acid transferase [Ignavibacterium sp.]
MDKICFLIYNIILIPGMFVFLRIIGLFNKKIRKGIIGRKKVYENIIIDAAKLDKRKKLIWFHSSSMGEFEQAKPIIEKLKSEQDVNILVTFFSPSGYENSKKYPYADIISYIPFDTKFNAERFISIVNPNLAIIMRYDIWPNIIKAISSKNIPILLVDATLRHNSLRKSLLLRSFHRTLFNYFTRILTVSESDAKEFLSLRVDEKKVRAVGDTRFDRVYQKSISAKQKNIIKPEILKDKKVFIAGSTWEQDEEVIFPAFEKLTKYEKDLIMIVVPHEPSLITIEKIENYFAKKIKTIRFSYLNDYQNEQIIIVDSIGILLTLYAYGDVAFVGGSFKQNVHNVLEAAVYGIPVIFGPKIHNSQEAKALANSGGGIIIKNKKDAYRTLRTLFQNDEIRKQKGQIAYEFVNKNIGATQKIIQEIYNYL